MGFKKWGHGLRRPRCQVKVRSRAVDLIKNPVVPLHVCKNKKDIAKGHVLGITALVLDQDGNVTVGRSQDGFFHFSTFSQAVFTTGNPP